MAPPLGEKTNSGAGLAATGPVVLFSAAALSWAASFKTDFLDYSSIRILTVKINENINRQ